MSKTITDLVAFCNTCIGKPYELGANGPDKYDCSSLLCQACKQVFGKEIPRSSTEQFSLGIEVSKDDLEEGDFIFFDTGWTDRKPNHVGIYIGNRKFINANSYNNQVVEDSLDSEYWENAWYGAKRAFTYSGDWLGLIHNNNTPLVFSDVPKDHPDHSCIIQLKEKGVIQGDTQTGMFRPNETLNRAECIKMVLTFFGITSSPTTTIPFSDVAPLEWYAPYICTAYERGIVHGYEDNTFRPANPITRAEAVKIIFTAKGESLADIPNSEWFEKYIKEAQKRSMLLPTSGDARPHESITRGEMARALCAV